ncbi:unnamed protein product, partial [Brassica napus]
LESLCLKKVFNYSSQDEFNQRCERTQKKTMRASVAASRLSDDRKLFRVLPTIQRYLKVHDRQFFLYITCGMQSSLNFSQSNSWIGSTWRNSGNL